MLTDTMPGIRMQDVMREELLKKNEQFTREAPAGESPHFERAAIRPDGETGYWSQDIPDFDGEEVRGFYVPASDFARLKQTQCKLEEQNRALLRRIQEVESATRAKSDFLANMSHELRTPLNGIIGLADTLKDGELGELTDIQTEYITDISDCGWHLLSLINDILDLAKVETGKMKLELSKFRLSNIFNSAEAVLKEKTMKHSIKLSRHIESEDDIEIEADERKLKQILFNLMSNAMKFTPNGGSVNVRARLVKGESFVPTHPSSLIPHPSHIRIFSKYPLPTPA